MSEADTHLTREAVDLLLELLELPEPVLSAASFELRAPAAAELLGAGLLVAHDYEDTTTSVGEHEDGPIALTWSEDTQSLSYFSPAAGFVAVPAEQLSRRAAAIGETLTSLTRELDLSRRGPSELLGGVVWELGDARLSKRGARVPVWFVRRLWDRTVQAQVHEVARNRPLTRQRLLLTSSRSERVSDVLVPGATVVSIRDVLEGPQGLAISAEILSARLSGVAPQAEVGPIVLSSDGRQLRINGDQFRFKSSGHIRAIRQLVSAYKAGERVHVSDLTDHGTLRRHFGSRQWKQLSPYVRSAGDGFWQLEP